MNERLIYFCDRADARCHLYAAVAAPMDGEILCQVYCRAALDDAWADPIRGADDLDPVRRQVVAAGGGMIASTCQTAGLVELRVAAVPGPGYDPPTELLVLSPDQEPERRPVGEQAITLGPGASVLLPATRADQSNLQGFADQLRRLPGDYRSLLLNVLRRPGIEAAMARLELRLDRLDSSLAPTALGGPQGTMPGAHLGNRWPWVLAGLLVLNLLGIAGLWFKYAGATATSSPNYHFEVPLDPRPWSFSLPAAPAETATPPGVRRPDLEGSSPRPAEHPKSALPSDVRPALDETGKQTPVSLGQ